MAFEDLISAEEEVIDEENEADILVQDQNLSSFKGASFNNSATWIYPDYYLSDANQDQEEVEITPSILEITQDGKVKIAFTPPVVDVPEIWKYHFIEKERQELTDASQEAYL